MEEMTPLTSTSDLQSGIQQVPSGNFNAVSQMFRKKRSDSFTTGQADRYSATDVASAYIPRFTADPAGTEVARQATGMGQFVMDPMTHLEEKVTVDRPYAPISFSNSPDSSHDTVRRKGISAYKRINGKPANKRFQGGK